MYEKSARLGRVTRNEAEMLSHRSSETMVQRRATYKVAVRFVPCASRATKPISCCLFECLATDDFGVFVCIVCACVFVPFSSSRTVFGMCLLFTILNRSRSLRVIPGANMGNGKIEQLFFYCGSWKRIASDNEQHFYMNKLWDLLFFVEKFFNFHVNEMEFHWKWSTAITIR